MTAFNVVRMRVKPGHEEEYLALHRDADLKNFNGMRSMNIVRTGEGEFVFVGEWDSMQDIAAARPGMIAMLDRVRGILEDLGSGLGVTDPRSGEAVVSR